MTLPSLTRVLRFKFDQISSTIYLYSPYKLKLSLYQPKRRGLSFAWVGGRTNQRVGNINVTSGSNSSAETDCILVEFLSWG